MKYTLRQTSPVQTLPAATFILHGLVVLFHSLDYWIAGCFSILMGVLYALYLAVWRLEFDTETGEFSYRAPFVREQQFYVDEITKFYAGGVHNSLLILEVHKMSIHIPLKTAEPLKQYLESRKKI